MTYRVQVEFHEMSTPVLLEERQSPILSFSESDFAGLCIRAYQLIEQKKVLASLRVTLRDDKKVIASAIIPAEKGNTHDELGSDQT